MQGASMSLLKKLWNIKKEFRKKVLFLSLTFAAMSCCLVIWRPLKVAVFSKMVGASLIPDAKLFSLLIVIPLILFYSKLVDWLRRHHLLYCFAISHAIGGMIFAVLLAHPVYGVSNTQASSARLLGWAFYFFMESFNAFFSMVFWSFVDSVNNPKDAKYCYGFIVSGSKIGGIISALVLFFALSYSSVENQHILLPASLLMGSFFLLIAAGMIYMLVKYVPDNCMHGYDAAYRLEKRREKENGSILKSLGGCVDGLLLMLKNPYVLGIFSMVVFYEIIVVIFDWRVALYADASSATVGAMTAYYAFYYFLMNSIGLVFALLGTTPLLRILGIRLSLFIFPIFCFLMLVLTYLFPTTGVFFVVLVALRALNYAFNHPTREILYIPTTKDIKFKAKTWTDAFGSRISKSMGSFFNISLKKATPAVAVFASLSLSFGLVFFWIIAAYFLGKRLQLAIDNKEVIGAVKIDGLQK